MHRFYVAACLFCRRRSQNAVRTLMMHLVVLHMPFCFLPHLDIFCDRLVNRCAATIDLSAITK